MQSSSAWLHLAQGLALGIPLTFGSSSLVPWRRDPFRPISAASGLSLAFALLSLATVLLAPAGAAPHPALRALRFDLVTGVMLVLVTFLGLVIARYSRAYLAGDAGSLRYVRWLGATLACVTLLLLADHLLLLAAAWMGTSLALHRLLTFYEDRTPALVAAHKKFLVSRLADGFLLGGIALVHSVVGRVDLRSLEGFLDGREDLPTSLEVATLLFVVAAALKSAQLPFHGWLTQVMEAPTPVSALLHAGIVNLGGFLMIRLAPLLLRSDVAATSLVALGTVTAVVASLVVSTRVSIKVALAWSTIAQMGLMLLECGLGAFGLALFHLVAHSLYKAHAFLSAGSVVDVHRSGVEGRERAPSVLTFGSSVAALFLLAVVSASVATVALAGTSGGLALHDLPFVVLLVLSLLSLPMRKPVHGVRGFLALSLRGLAVAALFGLAHAFAAEGLVPTEGVHAGASSILALVGFTALFVLDSLLRAAPRGRLARTLHPYLFAGLFLDELFTRWTFRLWPPHLPERTTPHHPILNPEISEA
ncbi:MAG: NADH-quinone oxidoreductase subunit L [Polyangiales bacterium]